MHGAAMSEADTVFAVWSSPVCVVARSLSNGHRGYLAVRLPGFS